MQDIPCKRAVNPPILSRNLDNVQTTGEKLHALVRHLRSIMRITWKYLSDKHGHTRTDRATIYGRSSDQKKSPADWTPHEDFTRQATKADFLLSTVFCSQKERGLSSPVQGHHQEKPEAERHKAHGHGGTSRQYRQSPYQK